MRHAGRRTPRWAQLTFTAAGSQIGRSAWQVAQVSEFATDQMREIMLAGGTTALDPHVEMPLFPTEDQLALERPHRLVHRPFQATLSALWHTTPAGVDAAGIPGNLFLHAALELGPGAPDPTHRAIAAWRSPVWLTPWGADAVLASRFEEMDDLPPGSFAGRDEAERFLDRPGVRADVLGTLVDAITATFDGGPNVALIADTVDDGAAWIAVVSHLLSQEVAARLSWSTYERAASVDPLRGFPLNLCVFPPVDEDALDELHAFGSRFTLIKVHNPATQVDQTEWSLDDDAAVVLAPAVEPTRVAVEMPPVVSIPAQTVPDDSERMELALVGVSADPDPIDLDEPVRVAEPRRSRRAPRSHRWTERRRPHLAVVPLPEPRDHPMPDDLDHPEPAPVPDPEEPAVEWSDVVPIEPAPEPVGRVATIAAPRVSVEVLPEKADVGQLWQELRAAKDMSGAAAARYVHIALLDRDCLFERVPAAAPQAIRWEERAWAEMARARDTLLADAATWHVRHEPAEAAVRVLRLVDFLVRTRVASDRPDGPPADRVVDLVRVHLPALAGSGGLDVQRRCGDLDGRTRFTVLQDAIWASGMPPHTFPDTLHMWLGISCWTRYPLR